MSLYINIVWKYQFDCSRYTICQFPGFVQVPVFSLKTGLPLEQSVPHLFKFFFYLESLYWAWDYIVKSVELEFWQFAFLEFYPFLPFGFSRLASWGQSVPHSIHRSDVLPQSAKEQKGKKDWLQEVKLREFTAVKSQWNQCASWGQTIIGLGSDKNVSLHLRW